MVSKSLKTGLVVTFLMVVSVQGQIYKSSNDVPSLRRVILKSAILPGLGQYSIGKSGTGKLFTLTEISLFLILYQSVMISHSTENRFKTFAADHAGINPSGKEAQYFVDIGNYNCFKNYNEEQQRFRNPSNVYPPDEGYDWEWDTETNREKFRTIRIKRDAVRKITRFTIGGIVLNHIVSSIHALYLHRKTYGVSKASVVPTLNLVTGEFGFQLTYAF